MNTLKRARSAALTGAAVALLAVTGCSSPVAPSAPSHAIPRALKKTALPQPQQLSMSADSIAPPPDSDGRGILIGSGRYDVTEPDTTIEGRGVFVGAGYDTPVEPGARPKASNPQLDQRAAYSVGRKGGIGSGH